MKGMVQRARKRERWRCWIDVDVTGYPSSHILALSGKVTGVESEMNHSGRVFMSA